MKHEQIKRWREAYPGIDASDEMLLGMPDCAVLYANDYIAYLEQGGSVPKETVNFLRSLHRECVWLYGNWAKAQKDANPQRLLADILNNAKGGGGEYTVIEKFLRDYMKANNIPDISAEAKAATEFDFDSLPTAKAAE